ncbi:unnamed protein product, partial [Closterium sp. NIES-53]
MASRALVSGLPRSLPPLPPGPAPTCVPCIEGRQRATPHSSSFPLTEAPLQTLHMVVWGPTRVRGQCHERYFLLVVDDYSRYTTVFPLRSKDEVPEVLIDWIRSARRQLSESFGSDLPGIRQTFTLPTSSQQNGIAERRIGMYAAHQINLQPRVSLSGTTPTLRWTGKVGDASAFRIWGSRAFVRDTTSDKLSSRVVPCVFLGFPPDAPGWQFYHPTSRHVLSSQDVTFDESVLYYRLFPYRTASPPPPPATLPGTRYSPAGPSGSGGVGGAGEAGRGVAGGSAPIASVSTPAKDDCGPKAWKILKDVHAPSREAMVVVLERQLHAVKINEGDAVQGAFDRLRDLYVKLSAAGVDYPEKTKCYKALSLLPESWGPLVVNLNGMKDSWSLEWIRAQVLQEEFRRKELTAAAGEGGGSAYCMKGFKGRGSKKGKAKEGSRGEQYSGGKRSSKGGKWCGGKCWYCHVEGHPWFKCRKLPDGWRPGHPSIEGSKGVHGAMGEGMGSEEGDGGAGGHGDMFYHVGEACSEDMVAPASKVALHRSSHWVINTGAFMTMTNREDLLDEFRPSKAATVVSASGQVVPVHGEGRAMFMGADGRLVGLKRVLLVPGLCANLLSTKALSEAGMKMEMMGTKVFNATLDGRVLWDLRGGKDMHWSMWEIPVLPWKEAAARLAAEAVRGGHVSHVTSGGGGDGSDGGLLVHGGGALPS